MNSPSADQYVSTVHAPIRILVTDDHPVMRDGLAAIIEEQKDMAVVGLAASGPEALTLHQQHRPDVTLMDLRMPGSDGLGMNGIQAVQAIRQHSPAARAIILSTYDTDEDIYRSLEAGAKAYLLKDVGRQVLLETIRAVHAGQSPVSPTVGAKLAGRIGYEELSDRELDVLRLLVKGRSTPEIAGALFIAESTVKFHINHILSKLGATDRVQAVIIALKRGLATLQ